jgi:isoleucyl-tRNA synthetase
MLSLDLYMSLLVREFMTTVTENYQNMEYNKVAQGITNFINRDVSAFYLSVSKDRLYCEASDSDEHWSAQKSLRLILTNLLLAIGPIAPHMAEEVFSHLPHLSSNLESSSFFQVGQSLWPSEGRRQGDVEKEKFLASLKTYFPAVLHVRDRVNQISSSKNISQLRLDLQVEGDSLFQFLERLQCADNAKPGCSELHDLFGVSQIHLLPWTQDNETSSQHAGEVSLNGEFCRFRFSVQQSVLAQCGRCRKYNVKENGRELCKRCLDVIGHNWSL